MFANPEPYEQFMGRWSRRLAPPFLEFADIPDGSQVLDVGSGTGSLSEEIATRKPGCQIVGIDASAEYVAYAKARVVKANLRFEIGNAQELPFPDAGFDAGLSLLVFNFIPDPAKALAELRRVTRSGGRICAATWDYGDGMEMLRIFWDATQALDAEARRADEKNMRLCRHGELAGLWKAGGLGEVEERALEIRMEFASFEDYWQPFFSGQGPAGVYLRGLTAEGRVALREQVMKLLPEAAQRGPFQLRGRAWAVRGTVTT